MMRFARPKTLDEALAIVAEGPFTPIAGGTDLMVRMRDGLVRPEGILDLTAIEELEEIRVSEDVIEIGALVTHTEIARSEVLANEATALVEAAQQIGSPQIRNRGTIGGNIVNASPAADSVPPLFVLGAEVLLASLSGIRTVPIEAFATGPGKTVRRQDELLTFVRIPRRKDGFRTVFLRLGTRKALAIAKVSVALGARVGADGTLCDVRVALGAVAPTVIRARGAEEALEGRTLTSEAILAACEAVRRDARPITDLRSTEEYRREMCAVLLSRALRSLVSGERQVGSG